MRSDGARALFARAQEQAETLRSDGARALFARAQEQAGGTA